MGGCRNCMLLGLLLVAGWRSQGLELYVTVAPLRFLVEAVGGDRVAVRAAIPAGRSPHDYQPTPAEIAGIAHCDAYLTCGLWFEQLIVQPLLTRSRVREMPIGAGIVRLPLAEGEAEEGHGDGGHADAFDQHIWLSPANAGVLLQDICRVLCELEPESAAWFEANLAARQRELAELERQLREELAPFAGRAFFVYHPAFGYFAAEFGLRQLAVERDGKTPTPRRLRELVALARADQIRTILVQPQYNQASAQALAAAIPAELATIDPLQPDLFAAFRVIAAALVKGFAP